MTCHWVEHSKMKPIDVDKLFKRRYFNNYLDSDLKVDEPNYEPVVAENIT